MKTSSSLTPILFIIGAVILAYYFLKNQSANSPFASPYGPGGYNPFGPNYGGGGGGNPGISTFNPGYSLNDLFGPGPNLSGGGVGNGGAVDPSVNTNSDFTGAESDPEAGL